MAPDHSPRFAYGDDGTGFGCVGGLMLIATVVAIDFATCKSRTASHLENK